MKGKRCQRDLSHKKVLKNKTPQHHLVHHHLVLSRQHTVTVWMKHILLNLPLAHPSLHRMQITLVGD